MNAKPITKPAPLGRGLSALFGDTDSSYQPKSFGQASKNKSGEIRTIPIEWVQPGAYQPRRHFDEEAIKGLAESIKERGVIQPLMVRPLAGENDSYEIIAGERRWRAAQMAGLHEVPVMVRQMSDRETMEIGLIENIQRQDLSPLEEAEGYRRLMEEFKHQMDGLSKVVGKSRSHIQNMIRLLNLPDSVKLLVDNGKLSMGHARTLIPAKDPLALANEIIKKGLSVRQAEALAKKESEGKLGKKTKPVALEDADTVALEKALSLIVGLKVKIHVEGESGSLTLFYRNLDQLDAVVQKLKG